MKKNVVLFSVFILLCLNAQLFGENTKTNKEWALIFNLGDPLLAVSSHNDGGGNAGIGIKYWWLKSVALRGLLMLNLYGTSENTDPPTSYTEIRTAIGAAIEYHFSVGNISPYCGGLVGLNTQPNPLDPSQTSIGCYLGGIFGVEAELWKYLSVFAEYDLLCVLEPNTSEAALGMGNNTQFGLLFYFK